MNEPTIGGGDLPHRTLTKRATKRSTRYYHDSKFRGAIDREKERARREAALGGWITYAIHDPTRSDSVGEFNTLIIYVGQTKQFDVRVADRLRSAGTAVRRPTDRIDGALYEVMARGGVPRFRVIERTGDALDSFVSETNWAKHYIDAGYPLLNKWTEQRFAGRPIGRDTVPHQWLWRLAVEDALEAKFDLVLFNRTTGEELVLDLQLFRPKELLRNVRRAALQRLSLLGQEGVVRISVK
jgi:hypothetical protein